MKDSPVQISRATAQDAEAVRLLVRRAYAKWVPVLGREPLPMKADYDRAIREHAIDLVWADGQLAALIETILAPDHLFIENIAVAPECQGQGLGRRLMTHAEQQARGAGRAEIRLLTSAAFEANIRLYQFVGFRIDRVEPFMGGTTVYMSKAIAPGIGIRPADVSDLPALTRIVAAAYGGYTDRIGKPPGPMLDDYPSHVRHHTAWVVESDGAVAGLIVLLPAEDHLLLDNVAVDPDCQGRGVGRALMAFAEQEAVRRGYTELRLYTHEKMTENLAMYPALGWRETGRGEQAGYRRVFFAKRV